jgi:hypothetical protein
LEHILHIVSFDVPYPPDYGGAIDIFYKIKALHELGVKVHLHCFEYHRKRNRILENYCRSVHYYPRYSGIKYFISNIPYIVKTRNDKYLTDNLMNDSHPILLEGLHSCLILAEGGAAGKKILVRTHNIEHEYYRNLASLEKNIGKKIYFKTEAAKLKYFEKILAQAKIILPISLPDYDYYNSRFEGKTHYLPPFHPYDKCIVRPGTGNYILYHGNLSVNENAEMAAFLSEKVFSKIPGMCVMAGKNPGKDIQNVAKRFGNINIILNPSETEMTTLITEAQINIIPSFTATGMKLKLIAALFAGRHCITNRKMIEGTGLENLCHVGESADEMIELINGLMKIPFSTEMIKKRNEVLTSKISNTNNAKTLLQLI